MDTRAFVAKAPPEVLLQLLRDAGLQGDVVVKGYDNPKAPAYYQKDQDLRRRAMQHLDENPAFAMKIAELIASQKT